MCPFVEAYIIAHHSWLRRVFLSGHDRTAFQSGKMLSQKLHVGPGRHFGICQQVVPDQMSSSCDGHVWRSLCLDDNVRSEIMRCINWILSNAIWVFFVFETTCGFATVSHTCVSLCGTDNKFDYILLQFFDWSKDNACIWMPYWWWTFRRKFYKLQTYSMSNGCNYIMVFHFPFSVSQKQTTCSAISAWRAAMTALSAFSRVSLLLRKSGGKKTDYRNICICDYVCY